MVTGDGRLVTCSDDRDSDLFNAVLSGMGQCGIIVSATIPLVRAPTHVLLFTLNYSDIATAAADLTFLADSERFDHLDGRSAAQPGGGFTFIIEAGAFYDAPDTPSEEDLLEGLSFTSHNAMDITFMQYHRRVPNPPRLAAQPWFIVYLPASTFVEYAARVFATPEEFAFGAPRFAAYRTSPIRRPLVRMPNEDLAFRFQIVRNPPASFDDAQALLATNRALFERARDVGGSRMTWAAIPFSQDDWVQHYGEAWPAFLDAKRRFDPNGVLTPGVGVF